MNWDAVGAVAEAVGTIAIFFSLIYMAIRIRLNTKEVSRSIEAERLAAFERNIESGNRTRELLIANPELTRVFLAGMAGKTTLEAPDKLRFEMMLRNIFSSMQGAYIRHLSVSHDPHEFAGSAELVDSILVNPGVREWLEDASPDWRPEFRHFVDERVAILDQNKTQ